MIKKLLIIISLFAFSLMIFNACDEGEAISFADPDGYLNNPLGIVGIKKGDDHYLIVGNTNFDLSSSTGSLSIIKYDTANNEYSFLIDKFITIDSFSGSLSLDSETLYIANRYDDAIDSYSISFDDSDNFDSITYNESTGSIEVGEDPYGLVIASPAVDEKYLLVSNLTTGSVCFIDLNSWQLLDPVGNPPVTDDTEDFDIRGILLDANTTSFVPRGFGVSKLVVVQNGNFALVASKSFNIIFVLDVTGRSVEGYIYLDNTYAGSSGGSRGMVTDSNDNIYVASRDGDIIYVLDGSKIEENYIDNDRIDGTVTDAISLLGRNPSSILLSNDESTLYVASTTDNQIDVVDITKREVRTNIKIEARPTEMIYLDNYLYVTNFDSSSVSVIDLTTNTVVNTIK